MSWKTPTFRTKVVAIILATCGTSLIVAGGIFFAFENRSYKTFTTSKLISISKIIGANTSSALIFEDKEAAEATLSALASERNIMECVIFDKKGREFARYRRDGSVPVSHPRAVASSTGVDIQKEYLAANSDITLKGEIIGNIHICSDMQLLHARLKQYALITGAILCVSLFAAFLVALRLHQVVSNPVSHLIRTARQISDKKDYSIRVPEPVSNDEISVLVKTFNLMLENIQERDKALQTAHDSLETRVEERTGELRKEMNERRQTEETLQYTNTRLNETLTQLKHAQEQIIQSERLKALGEMASGIAHDFNNALMPILGYTNLILTNPDIINDREDAISMLKDVNLAAKDAAEVVRRLREFYKPSLDSERKIIDLNCIFESAVSMTRPKWRDEMASKGTQIEIKHETQEAQPIMANESKIREVIINLILNAIDAMPKGGTITLRTHKEGHWTVGEIEDTGTGMDAHVLQRCFDPFFTTKGGRGSGLGLSIVHGIIRQHNGWIDIKSTPGKGTTVKLRFPEASGPDIANEDNAPRTQQTAAGKLNILLIDDEEMNTRMIEKFLKTSGFTVSSAKDGIEGLKLFKEGNFDLVITDRSMPHMSGDALAAEIRSINSKVPVIMLTGFAELMEISHEVPPGVTLVLNKPVTRLKLNQAIASVISAT